MWLFIASEVMLFGGLFSAYVLLRAGASHWDHGGSFISLTMGLGFTALLALATLALTRRTRQALALVTGAGTLFLAVKAWSYATMWNAGVVPATSTFAALYYLITGVHALHVLGGVIASLWFAQRARVLWLYWGFVDVVWIGILIAFYS